LTKEADQLYYLYCRSREWISMAIIASAIFGRSAFTFGRIRIIRFISSEERCPSNMIYKHALVHRLISGRHTAIGDLADFQDASDEHTLIRT